MKVSIKIYHTKTDIWYYLLAYLEVMVMSLYGDILPADSVILGWVQTTFLCVKEHRFFDGLNFVLLLAAYVYLLDKQLGRKVFRLSRCVAWGMSIVLVVYCFSKHPSAFVYLCLTFSFLFSGFWFELAKLFDAIHKQNETSSGLNGFVLDYSHQDNLQDVGWEKYAECLLTRLEATPLYNTSFALALTGKWGTGKSTFLGYLKNELRKANLNYLEFNPWLSSSAENIVKDFFESLSGKLKEQGIELEDEIDEYVRLLFRWGSESLASRVVEFWGLDSGHDLGSLRSKISEELNALDDKIYVLIDDVDRLQSNEIFEILKLIRNTADFNHIVYVVTFDKEYVTKSLQSLHIANHEEYLKKIFQMELNFPMFENYLITYLFNEEMLSHSHYPAKLQNQLDNLEKLLGKDEIYLGDYLANFRDAKRMVNEFLLNIDYIVKQDVIDDFSVRDLFLMQLFEFTDGNAFAQFKGDLWSFVHTCSSDRRFVEINDAVGGKFHGLSKKTRALLLVLFPPVNLYKPLPKRNSIRRQDKVYTYFSFRPYAYQMSLSDFQQLLHSSSEEAICSYVKKSSLGILGKESSMYNMMKEQHLNGLERDAIKNFITLLLAWTHEYHLYDLDKIGSLYRDVLLKQNIDENNVDYIKNILNPFFTGENQQDYDYCILQKIFCKMMPCLVDSDDGQNVYYPECIYDWDELRSLLGNNTKSFLDRVRPSAQQILEKSRLHQFIKCSIVYNEAYSQPQFDSFPVQEELVEYFSQNKNLNDISVFLEKFCLQHYEGKHVHDRIQNMKKDIVERFTSVPFYITFLKECFVHEDEHELERYFRNNGLNN